MSRTCCKRIMSTSQEEGVDRNSLNTYSVVDVAKSGNDPGTIVGSEDSKAISYI